jgi:hypothetical protein
MRKTRQVKYSKLVHSGATQTELREQLVGGDMTTITMCDPKNIKETGAEAVRFRGMSSSVFMRSRAISESSRRG